MNLAYLVFLFILPKVEQTENGCPSGFSQNDGSTVIKKRSENVRIKSTIEDCGIWCDVKRDCRSFEYINETDGVKLPRGRKPGNCILHDKMYPKKNEKRTTENEVRWTFCSKKIYYKGCPSGFSQNNGSTDITKAARNVEIRETPQDCGFTCDIREDCYSFEYINERDVVKLPEGDKLGNCILHPKIYPENYENRTSINANKWTFCGKSFPVAKSSFACNAGKYVHGPNSAVDDNTTTFSKICGSQKSKYPWITLFFSTMKKIHNVTLIMNEGEPVNGTVTIIQKTMFSNEENVCGTFSKLNENEDERITVKCKSTLNGNAIKIEVTDDDDDRKHILQINEVSYTEAEMPEINEENVTKEAMRKENYTIIICLCLSLYVIIIILFLSIVLFYKSKKENRAEVERIFREKLNGDKDKLNPDIPIYQQVEVLPYKLKKYEIAKDTFTIGHKIGDGQFGMVSLGTVNDGNVQVAVKQIKNSLDDDHIETMIGELKIMSNLESHPNLVNLVAACTSEIGSKKIYLLLEYCSFGDLKRVLLDNRHNFIANMNNAEKTDDAEFKPTNLLNWCYDIAKGMEYLESKLIMHGDLAARNILVDEKYVAKISDFGLSKQMYYQQNYQKVNRRMIPWAWMALEYLETGEFNLKSDVWSYGVLAWEIYSLGNKPYGIVQFENMKKRLIAGERLPVPDHMKELDKTDELYNNVMKPCWEETPDNRPKFGNIIQTLEKILENGTVEDYNLMSETLCAKGEDSYKEEKNQDESKNLARNNNDGGYLLATNEGPLGSNKNVQGRHLEKNTESETPLFNPTIEKEATELSVMSDNGYMNI